ncbi:energy-coupling factor transporter transmembrane component T [Eggerthella sinensis]|uniref:energy-coupling factor transporter transmembrane component T n=1 Tax=Eggerthella sinensis TaxID=242230 RepID=UPI001D07CB45|nr:energy-coupling factor transporter transmembrane component T [Eggerthella sinensis]MCB7037564.1 energy-coupling factor transporter transmembrane protein EcfT [Eggerthella sinensis]
MELLQTGAVERTVRLDPRTKLVLLVSVSTVLLIGGNGTIMDAARTIMLLAPFGLLAVSGRRGAAAALLAAYAGAQALSALVVPNVDGPLNFLIVASCMIAARFLPTIATAYFVFATTTVSEFMAAAERVHAPQWLVIPLSVLFRFFPTLGEEARAIGSAMRMRGLRVGSAGPVKLVECRLVPLITCAVQIGEDLSAASLTRGLGAPVRRTNVCEIGFGPADAAVLATCAACLAALAASSLGWTVG